MTRWVRYWSNGSFELLTEGQARSRVQATSPNRARAVTGTRAKAVKSPNGQGTIRATTLRRRQRVDPSFRWPHRRARHSTVASHYGPLLAGATAANHQALLKAAAVDGFIAGSLAVGATSVVGASVSTWAVGWAQTHTPSDPPAALTSLMDSVSNATPPSDAAFDGEAQAESAAAWASEAGAQDSMAAQGIEQWNFVAEAGACQMCQDAEDGSPYNVGDGPQVPAHAGCGCESQPVTDNDDSNN